MDLTDVGKFLSKNLKCTKSYSILNKIQYKYGTEYMLGCLCGNPISINNNLFQRLYYNPQSVTKNLNIQTQGTQWDLNGEDLFPESCKIMDFTESSPSLFQDNNNDSILNFGLNTRLYKQGNMEENLNLKFMFKLPDISRYERFEYNQDGVKFGYNMVPINCEFINVSNYYIDNNSHVALPILNKCTKLEINNLSLAMCIHIRYNKDHLLYNICRYNENGIIDEQLGIRQNLPTNISKEQFFQNFKVFWNLNSSVYKTLQNEERIYMLWKDITDPSMMNLLKPFLIKIKSL